MRGRIWQALRQGALGFAIVQAVGQCLYVRPYVEAGFNPNPKP
jgi:hypothetical protein